MAARPYIIPRVVHDVLTGKAVYRGPRVVITEQLGPDVWPHVKTTLEWAGAVYVIGASTFEFDHDQDARAIVDAALAAGQVRPLKQSAGWVATPADLAADVVAEFAEIGATRGGTVLRVLDPSAGTGALINAVMRGDLRDAERCAEIAGWMRVTAVEIDVRRARQIPSSPAVRVVRDDFDQWAARTLATPARFDRVVMNPPFSVPGDPHIWTRHLATAWELLAPGGRLVAIVPASVADATHRAKAVREIAALVAEHGGYKPLGRDAFAESGIKGFATGVVWLDRPLVDTPPPLPADDGRPAWVARPYTGEETPVAVLRPFLTRAAARLMPVQECADWAGQTRTVRFRGECAGCARLVWSNGYGDPRGDIGLATCASLSAGENGAPAVLPDVVQCFGCSDTGESNARVLARAQAYWASARLPEPVREPAVHVSAWTQDVLPI